jgi:hypothetical protein
MAAPTSRPIGTRENGTSSTTVPGRCARSASIAAECPRRGTWVGGMLKRVASPAGSARYSRSRRGRSTTGCVHRARGQVVADRVEQRFPSRYRPNDAERGFEPLARAA